MRIHAPGSHNLTLVPQVISLESMSQNARPRNVTSHVGHSGKQAGEQRPCRNTLRAAQDPTERSPSTAVERCIGQHLPMTGSSSCSQADQPLRVLHRDGLVAICTGPARGLEQAVPGPFLRELARPT